MYISIICTSAFDKKPPNEHEYVSQRILIRFNICKHSKTRSPAQNYVSLCLMEHKRGKKTKLEGTNVAR